MTVSGTFAILLKGQSIAQASMSDDIFQFDHTVRMELTDGSGANQANKVFRQAGTIADGANLDLDFAGGGLLDVHGAGLTLTDIRAIYLRNSLVTGATIRLGGSATNRIQGLFNASTDFLDLKPGAATILTYPAANDVVVTPGTGDILRLTCLGTGTGSYELIVIGVG